MKTIYFKVDTDATTDFVYYLLRTGYKIIPVSDNRVCDETDEKKYIIWSCSPNNDIEKDILWNDFQIFDQADQKKVEREITFTSGYRSPSLGYIIINVKKS